MVKFYVVILVVALILVIAVAAPVHADAQRVQMPGSGWDPIGSRNASIWCRLGQRLTIPDRELTSIGYRIIRVGNATGDVIISMYAFETKDLIVSKVWGDAGDLPTKTSGYSEVEMDPPIRINREVIICVEYYGGNATDYCMGAYFTGDRIPGESYMNYYHYGQWHDIGEAEEGSYCYEYVGGGENPEPGNGNTDNNSGSGVSKTLIAVIVGVAVMCVTGSAAWRRHKKNA